MEQIHGQWQHANFATDPQRQAYLFQSALALRGAARIHYVYHGVAGDGCQIMRDGRASGHLTSSTRLTTAHHVSAPAEQLQVFFEARVDQDGIMSGKVVSDGDDIHLSHYLFDRAYPYPTKYDYQDENPLLINRLAQLGIELTGPGQVEARRYLRGPWNFEVERDEFPAIHTDGQLDVAVLRATSRDLPFSSQQEGWRYLASGSFPGRAPGVFFDYRPYRSLSHCPTEPDENGDCPDASDHGGALLPDMESTPLWAIHNNFYPGDLGQHNNLGIPYAVGIASNPFPYIIDGQPDTSGVVKGIRMSDPGTYELSFCVDDSPQEFLYGDEFEVSLDAFRGSSGGALFHPLRFVSGDTIRESSTRIYPHATVVAITGEPRVEVITECWYPEGDNTDYLLAVTAASDAVERWSRHDDATDEEEDPDNPSPEQPPTDGEPRCSLYDDSRRCLSYSGSLLGSPAFAPIENPVIYYWPADLPSDEADAHQANAEDSAYGLGDWLLTNCGASHEPFTKDGTERVGAGIGVGFIGSLRFDPGLQEPDDQSVVGYLRMVCTPWSSEPFIVNWPFLRTAGTSYRNTQDDTAHFRRRFGTLAEILATVGEVRHHNGASSLRPLSMKTCPPNYFLRGVNFHTRTHANGVQRVLASIQSLECKLSTNPYDPDETPPEGFTVELYPEDTPSCAYRLGDFCFSLGQLIGWSHPVDLPQCRHVDAPAACEQSIRCPIGEVAHGIAYQRDADGFIVGFGLKCIEEPG